MADEMRNARLARFAFEAFDRDETNPKPAPDSPVPTPAPPSHGISEDAFHALVAEVRNIGVLLEGLPQSIAEVLKKNEATGTVKKAPRSSSVAPFSLGTPKPTDCGVCHNHINGAMWSFTKCGHFPFCTDCIHALKLQNNKPPCPYCNGEEGYPLKLKITP